MLFNSIAVEPLLPKLVLLALIIVTVGFVLRLVRQPYVVAYIIAGVLLGPSGLEIVTDEGLISNLGSLGLILLLFFIGMEISLPNLVANWRISVLGTLIQIIASVCLVGILGHYLEWPLNRVILIGFVISLSSTAVIIKLLQDRNEVESEVGRNVIGILLVQDILIVPMLITVNIFGGESPSSLEIIKQVLGGFGIIGILAWVLKKKHIILPFRTYIRSDRELQVFVAFTLCFGFAALTALSGLSSALGAFVAGILVSSARSTQWVHDSLHSFRVVFVALFFVSIGMLINIDFLIYHWAVIGLLLISVFVVNHFINTLTMKVLGDSWKESLHFGALLSQIGEFSFILGIAGYEAGMINEYGYQLTISVIALSLLISPLWIAFTQRVIASPELP